MLETDFLPLIVVATIAFGVGLVWVVMQWAKADKHADNIERQVQHRLDQIQSQPETVVRYVGEDEETAARMDREERVVGRLLFWWGLAAMSFGMAIGAIPGGFVGALIGGAIGPVVAAVGIVIVVGIKGVGVERAEKRAAEPEHIAAATASDEAHHTA